MLAADLGEAFPLPGIAPAKLKETVRATLDELEAFQCAGRRLRVLEGRVRLRVALPDQLRAARACSARSSSGYAVPAPVLEKGYAYLERRAAAANVRRTRAGGPRTRRGRPSRSRCWPGRAQRGQPRRRALLRLRWTACRCSPWPTCATRWRPRGETGARPAELERRIAQRDPARGRHRARRGAGGPVPALVLELERALDRDRAGHAGAQRPATRRWPRDGALADAGARGGPLGQHAGERGRHGGAGRLLPEVRGARCPTSRPWSRSAGDAGCRRRSAGRSTRRRRRGTVPMARARVEGRAGRAHGPRLRAGGHGHAALRGAAALRAGRAAGRRRWTRASRSSAATRRPKRAARRARRFKAGDW